MVRTPSGPVRVTIAQIEVSNDHAANLLVVRSAFTEAQRLRADLLVLPEYASGFDPRGVGVEHAEPLDGPFVTTLQRWAAETGVAVIAGTTLPGTGTGTGAATSSAAARAVNAVVAIDGAGTGSACTARCTSTTRSGTVSRTGWSRARSTRPRPR